MEVLVRPYVRTADAVFGRTVALLVSDETRRAEAYRKAGLTALAEKHEYLKTLAGLRCKYEPLDEIAAAIYLSYFSVATDISKYQADVPEEVLGHLIHAQKEEHVSKITLHSHPRTGETIALATAYSSQFGKHLFLIVQWGETISDAKQLFYRRLRQRTVGKQAPAPVKYSLTILSAIAAIAVLHLLTGGSLLYPVVMALAFVGFWIAAAKSSDARVRSVRTMLTAASLASCLFGLVEWNTADRLVQATVCDSQPDSRFYGFNDPVVLSTTADEVTLTDGIYNQAFYAGDNLVDIARGMEGQVVELTVHGHIGSPLSNDSPPYATAGKVIGTGNCGS